MQAVDGENLHIDFICDRRDTPSHDANAVVTVRSETLPRHRRRPMAGTCRKAETGTRREAGDVMNGGLSVRWPDQWIARCMKSADQVALVEKRGAVGSLQSGLFDAGHPRGDRKSEMSQL